MSLNHRPLRSRPSADRMHERFVERLARGGQPLVSRPLQELLPRPRRRRGVPLWRVAELTRRIVTELVFGGVLGVVSVVAFVGPVGHGMGWI